MLAADMWPGAPGPLMRPPDPNGPPPNPLAAAPKNTTIYVGKIAATLDDDVITKLLEACGKVKTWKPVKDPSNNKPKGFGFVEYEVGGTLLLGTAGYQQQEGKYQPVVQFVFQAHSLATCAEGL